MSNNTRRSTLPSAWKDFIVEPFGNRNSALENEVIMTKIIALREIITLIEKLEERVKFKN